jgi:hypothetical protein
VAAGEGDGTHPYNWGTASIAWPPTEICGQISPSPASCHISDETLWVQGKGHCVVTCFFAITTKSFCIFNLNIVIFFYPSKETVLEAI